MSGKDEKPLKDFPVCLECQDSVGSYFWKGYSGTREMGLVFFDRIGYAGLTEPRVVRGYGNGRRTVTLEEVNLVTAIRCGSCDREVVGDLFDKIILIGRKIVVRER